MSNDKFMSVNFVGDNPPFLCNERQISIHINLYHCFMDQLAHNSKDGFWKKKKHDEKCLPWNNRIKCQINER